MARWWQRLGPAIAAMFLVLGTVTTTTAVSSAEEAVLIPGATVFKRFNPFYPLIATTYPVIGINFHDDDDPQVVGYSQNALASEWALRDGVKHANIAVRQTEGKVVVIGESMGAMVASRLAAKLAADPDAPSTDDIRFVLIAPPEAGVAGYFKEGTYIPILNYRISRIAESPYATTIVIGEYDGWADPPDRPWNLISSANALMGIVYVHGPPIAAVDPESLPPENTTTHTNGAGGIVTTHFVPTENLPLTQVFRDVGVPGVLVDKVDRVLRPIVDAGYVRHDRPGDRRPYLRDGALHRNVQGQQQARAQSRQSTEDTEDPEDTEGTIHAGEDHRGPTSEVRNWEKTTAEPTAEAEAPASDRQASSESSDGDG